MDRFEFYLDRLFYAFAFRFTQWLALLAGAGLSATSVVQHRNEDLVLNNRNNAYLSELSGEDVATYRFDGVFRRSADQARSLAIAS